jgi:hypothetical protein
LGEKQRDLLSLSTADVQVADEPLGATMDRLAVEGTRGALASRLKSSVGSLPVQFAVMLHEQSGRFVPILHVFRKGQREISVRLAQALPDCPAIDGLLGRAVRTGFVSENFRLTSTGKAVVAEQAIHDIGVIVIADTHCMIAFLNRRLRPRGAEEANDPGAWTPWDNYVLDALRERFRVSPLQISHAIFEKELPRLLREHPGQWVVYYKDECLGIRPSEAEAEQLAINRGITERETYLAQIEEEPPLSVGCRLRREG